MQKWRLYGIAALFAGLLCGFAAFGFCLPVALQVKVTADSVYDDTVLTKDDVSVAAVTLFGRTFSVDDFTMTAGEYNTSLEVFYRELSRTADLSLVPIREIRASYGEPVYVSDTLRMDQVTVTLEYEDGTEHVLDSFVMEPYTAGMTTADSITISTVFGDTSLIVEPIIPTSIRAEYDGVPTAGDSFDQKAVRVYLEFEDGTERQISDFEVIDAPEVISEDASLTVTTAYGDTTLTLEPVKVKELHAAYTGTAAVGDLINREDLSMEAVMEDGEVVAITDFTFADPGSLKTGTKLWLKSRYGNASVDIVPTTVTNVQADLTSVCEEGAPLAVDGFTFTFADDTTKTVSASDVTFLTSSETLSGGKTEYWFLYEGVPYSFTVDAVPSRVMAVRNPEGSTDGIRYDLTEEQLEEIAAICQRVASDDLSEAAAEASLLANRYELYSGLSEGSGSDLVSYLESDGYWGEDVASYAASYSASEDVVYVVKDVLMNGYRALPLYVDERDLYSDVQIPGHLTSDEEDGSISFSSPVSLVEDQTDVIGSKNRTYRFYRFIGDDQVVFGYTETAWQAVSGTDLPAASSMEAVSMETESADSNDGIIIGDSIS